MLTAIACLSSSITLTETLWATRPVLLLLHVIVTASSGA